MIRAAAFKVAALIVRQTEQISAIFRIVDKSITMVNAENNSGNQPPTLSILRKIATLSMGLLKKYFNILPDKDNEEETIRNISKGASFHGASLWILVFAIFIASLGLNVNSTAVIIGAMLISPLMGPIIGMGLAVGINDFDLLKRSAKNYLVATIISVATATLYFLLTPLDEAQSELLARTSPTLYDVLIALCGGAAGIVALATKDKGNVLPGVAIATALMPPFCTAGCGLASGSIMYFLGAFNLFFINTVFISLATYIGVRMMKFQEKQFVDKARQSKVKRYIIAVTAATMIPAGIMTVNIVGKSLFMTNVNRFVKEQLEVDGTRIVSYEANRDSLMLKVVAVGREISDSALKTAMAQLRNYKMDGYRLEVIQGTKSDSVMMLTNRLSSIRTTNDNYAALLNQEMQKSARLQERLKTYTNYEALTPSIAKEIRALFPSVTSISLSNSLQVSTDSLMRQRRATAIIGTTGKLTSQDYRKMKAWLSTRIDADTLQLITLHE